MGDKKNNTDKTSGIQASLDPGKLSIKPIAIVDETFQWWKPNRAEVAMPSLPSLFIKSTGDYKGESAGEAPFTVNYYTTKEGPKNMPSPGSYIGLRTFRDSAALSGGPPKAIHAARKYNHAELKALYDGNVYRQESKNESGNVNTNTILAGPNDVTPLGKFEIRAFSTFLQYHGILDELEQIRLRLKLDLDAIVDHEVEVEKVFYKHLVSGRLVDADSKDIFYPSTRPNDSKRGFFYGDKTKLSAMHNLMLGEKPAFIEGPEGFGKAWWDPNFRDKDMYRYDKNYRDVGPKGGSPGKGKWRNGMLWVESNDPTHKTNRELFGRKHFFFGHNLIPQLHRYGDRGVADDAAAGKAYKDNKDGALYGAGVSPLTGLGTWTARHGSPRAETYFLPKTVFSDVQRYCGKTNGILPYNYQHRVWEVDDPQNPLTYTLCGSEASIRPDDMYLPYPGTIIQITCEKDDSGVIHAKNVSKAYHGGENMAYKNAIITAWRRSLAQQQTFNELLYMALYDYDGTLAKKNATGPHQGSLISVEWLQGSLSLNGPFKGAISEAKILHDGGLINDDWQGLADKLNAALDAKKVEWSGTVHGLRPGDFAGFRYRLALTPHRSGDGGFAEFNYNFPAHFNTPELLKNMFNTTTGTRMDTLEFYEYADEGGTPVCLHGPTTVGLGETNPAATSKQGMTLAYFKTMAMASRDRMATLQEIKRAAAKRIRENLPPPPEPEPSMMASLGFGLADAVFGTAIAVGDWFFAESPKENLSRYNLLNVRAGSRSPSTGRLLLPTYAAMVNRRY